MSIEKLMRVLHAMRTYGINGGERQLARLFSQQNSVQLQESFLFVYHDPDCEEFFLGEAPNLALHSLHKALVPRSRALKEFLSLLPKLLFLQFCFWRFIKSQRFDACVIHGFQAALIAWPSVCLMRNIGFAYMHRGNKRQAVTDPIFRLLFAPFRVVVGNSDATTKSLARYVTENKLFTIANGIDCNRFLLPCGLKGSVSTQHDLVTLITVGRLIDGKGLGFLIESMKLLKQVERYFRLYIIGEGPKRPELEALISEMKLEGQVHLLGRSNNIAADLTNSDIFLFASEKEGLSNAVLEAMAAGLPSVVVDAEGVSECHLDGITAHVVQRSPQAFVEAILSLLRNAKAKRDMGQAATDLVRKKFSSEINRQRFNDLYSQIVEKK